MTLTNTTTSTPSEINDCNAMSALARPVRGIVSVGLKAVTLSVVALPQLAAGTMDAATRTVMLCCLVVVIVFAVVPWRYVWQQFVVAQGDRWR